MQKVAVEAAALPANAAAADIKAEPKNNEVRRAVKYAAIVPPVAQLDVVGSISAGAVVPAAQPSRKTSWSPQSRFPQPRSLFPLRLRSTPMRQQVSRFWNVPRKTVYVAPIATEIQSASNVSGDLAVANTVADGGVAVVAGKSYSGSLFDDIFNELPREASNNVIPIVTLPDKPSVSLRSLTSVRTTTPIVLFQPVQRETVRLENDNEQAIFERPKPDNIRQALNSFLNPTPIVDRIKEEEKYGNMGDKFAGFSRAIVNAYESLSNFLNTVVDVSVL
ncbi:hypothetical protein EAI_13402 [Harpegnathos saltator]|uniref:Uncharacterized protein n=1 Tax=Harpegnathos saltator TaxID=610380 RepID=E2B960_HARSA|nr:hypothetical protein EAI_13402 [Harpegnathos saltator]